MYEPVSLENQRLRCDFCGETIALEGNDPWDLLLLGHYCPVELTEPAAATEESPAA